MRFITTCLAAALIATSAFAQDDMAARRAAAESYLSSPANQKMMEAMFAPEQLVTMLRAQVPNATPEQLDAVAKIVSEELAAIRSRMEAVMLDAAIKQFTTEELQALDGFYRSPVGESVMVKMPDFMKAYMTDMGPDMMKMQQNIATRVSTEVMNK